MAQMDVYGLRKAVTKQVDLSLEQYDGTARDGDLIIDMNPGNTQYMIFIGMENGYLTGLTANSANFANYAGNVTVASQPNITAVGTLVDLDVAGDTTIGGNTVITGNLTVDGDITYINITNLQVEDPIIMLGGGPNGAPLTSNDGKDRGTQLQVYDTGAGAQVPKFMGWDDSAGQFILGSNITNASDVITVNTYGNLQLDTLIASNASVTGNVAGGNITTGGQVVATGNVVSSANVDGVNMNASGNMVATGNVAGGNVTTGGQVVATGNVVSSANVDGVNMNASGNVVATGNVAGGNVTTGGQVVATGNVVSSANVDGVNMNASGNVVATGNVSGQNVSATANVSSANLTVAVGTVDFTTTANVSLGAVANLHVTGGVSGQVLSTDGSGTLSWVDANTAPGGSGANTQVVFNDAGVMGSNSTFTFNKTTDVLAVGNLSLTANLSVGGEVLTNLNPTGNKIYDLGNATNRWGNIYLSNNSLYLGAVHVTSNDVDIVNIPNVATANVAATGDIVAANITANVDITATGNISAGNLSTGGDLAVTGNVSATGNVDGGNITTAGSISAFDINVTDANVGANLTVVDTVTTANLTTTGTTVDFTTATAFTLGSNTSLSGTTLLSDAFVSRADTSGASATFDCGTADYFTYTVTGATTFAATNVPAAGRLCTIMVEVVNGGSGSITYFTGTKWASGTAPTLTAAGTDVLAFYTTDGGTSWTGLVLALNVS